MAVPFGLHDAQRRPAVADAVPGDRDVPLWDDPTPANNDIEGTVAGIFDLATFSTTFDYTITAGAGAFAGATGFGESLVLPNLITGTYTETGRLVILIPEPVTLALLIGALLPVIPAFARRVRASRLNA